MKFQRLLLLILFPLHGISQNDTSGFVPQADTIASIAPERRAIWTTHDYVRDTSVHNKSIYNEYPYNKQRVKLITAGNIVGYGASMAGLYSAWYSQYPQSAFHTFNDDREWLQIDKVGHTFSAYSWSYASMETWRWTGISRNKRIWLGGLSGAAYQTVIEVLDGFSAEWGWSWGDFVANIAGSSLLIGQELQWNEQRVRLKFSFHKKQYGAPDLSQRANELYGKRITQRFLKDYNAQTYWVSMNLKSFMPNTKLPAWLNIAAGYGAEGMFGAEENIGRDKLGNITFNRTDVKRYRQFYLAPDVDFNKIRTNNKVLKVALGVLNIFKFPTPSLEFSNNKFRWNWLHF